MFVSLHLVSQRQISFPQADPRSFFFFFRLCSPKPEPNSTELPSSPEPSTTSLDSTVKFSFTSLPLVRPPHLVSPKKGAGGERGNRRRDGTEDLTLPSFLLLLSSFPPASSAPGSITASGRFSADSSKSNRFGSSRGCRFESRLKSTRLAFHSLPQATTSSIPATSPRPRLQPAPAFTLDVLGERTLV